MLGITTHITTDLSPQPMFWLVPLILYLASFIFVFARWPVVWTETPHTIFLYAQPLLHRVDDFGRRAASDERYALSPVRHVRSRFGVLYDNHGLSRRTGEGPPKHQAPDRVLPDDVGRRHARRHVQRPSRAGHFPVGHLGIPAVHFRRRPGPARRCSTTGLFDNFLASLFESQPDAPVVKPGHKGHKAALPRRRHRQ